MERLPSPDRFDARELDHFGPLRSFLGDELSEVSR
jgi:hypothetical protein